MALRLVPACHEPVMPTKSLPQAKAGVGNYVFPAVLREDVGGPPSPTKTRWWQLWVAVRTNGFGLPQRCSMIARDASRSAARESSSV
jgi:hypothetical protein